MAILEKTSTVVESYKMPPEWDHHEATWLSWPHNQEAWPAGALRKIQDIYTQMMEVILTGEKINLLVKDQRMREEVLERFRYFKISEKNLYFHYVPTVDIWIRDYGPIFIKSPNGKKGWCKWQFNAWGNKYENYVRDNGVFQKDSAMVAYPCLETGFVLEGGSIDVNGKGICLTTQQCLLNQNREPNRTKAKVESYLNDYLGIHKVIWLNQGIEGDDTDGHVDDVARFVNPNTVLAAYENDPLDENYEALKENWERLNQDSAYLGVNPNLVKLPMPGKISSDNMRRPASYANFYICNAAVLLPVFSQPQDEIAKSIFKELFPDRRIVPILSTALVVGLGAIHCVTQQEPA